MPAVASSPSPAAAVPTSKATFAASPEFAAFSESLALLAEPFLLWEFSPMVAPFVIVVTALGRVPATFLFAIIGLLLRRFPILPAFRASS
jgi:hypothetical protein